jgi:hypothetical protein
MILCFLQVSLYFLSTLADHSCSGIIDDYGYLDFSRATMVRRPPRFAVPYDHTCKIMKARYNCAHGQSVQDGETATDWILGFSLRSGRECLMKDLLLRSGGVESVSKHIAKWSHRNSSDHKAHILLTGNSFLRQVFEAIICNYHKEHHSLIKSVTVEMGGPDMAMQALRDHAQYATSSLGAMVDLESVAGCHHPEPENTSHWYEPSVPLPPNTALCNDNIARVEIANVVFYYVFRPYAYRDLGEVFVTLGWDVSKFDAVVSNEDIATQSVLSTFTKKGVTRVIDVKNLLDYFRRIQKQRLHKWFGADNIGVTGGEQDIGALNKPRTVDDHPCMPGVPDDEVDVLLFLLRHNVPGIAWNQSAKPAA